MGQVVSFSKYQDLRANQPANHKVKNDSKAALLSNSDKEGAGNKASDSSFDSVVKFSSRRFSEQLNRLSKREATNSLIPIELGAGFDTAAESLAKLNEYGLDAIDIRVYNEDSGTLLHFMALKDALWLNARILESENVSDREALRRIDTIQMLENASPALIDSLWGCFSKNADTVNQSTPEHP